MFRLNTVLATPSTFQPNFASDNIYQQIELYRIHILLAAILQNMVHILFKIRKFYPTDS